MMNRDRISSNLEFEVADVADMSKVSILLLEHFQDELRSLKTIGLSGVQTVDQIERLSGPLIFVVRHICTLALRMRETYYEETERRRA